MKRFFLGLMSLTLLFASCDDDDLMGAEVGMNANDLTGCFSLSNSIMVTRQ